MLGQVSLKQGKPPLRPCYNKAPLPLRFVGYYVEVTFGQVAQGELMYRIAPAETTSANVITSFYLVMLIEGPRGRVDVTYPLLLGSSVCRRARDLRSVVNIRLLLLRFSGLHYYFVLVSLVPAHEDPRIWSREHTSICIFYFRFKWIFSCRSFRSCHTLFGFDKRRRCTARAAMLTLCPRAVDFKLEKNVTLGKSPSGKSPSNGTCSVCRRTLPTPQ